MTESDDSQNVLLARIDANVKAIEKSADQFREEDLASHERIFREQIKQADALDAHNTSVITLLTRTTEQHDSNRREHDRLWSVIVALATGGVSVLAWLLGHHVK